MLLSDDDLSALEERLICANCIGEEYLKGEVERDGNRATCFYCGKTGRAISIGELSGRLKTVFEEHFQRTSAEPSNYEYALLRDRETNYVWERAGEPVAWVIAEAAEIDNAPAEHLQQVLEWLHYDLEDEKMGEENPFAKDAHYDAKGPDDYEFRTDWNSFQRRLRTETRFFNREFEDFLDLIFAEITEHTVHDKGSVIIDAGPDRRIAQIYRARVFYSDDKLRQALVYSDQKLGPPPFSAAAAGRMNAKGISVFYGATDPDVALTEVRPPVGSRVVVARFEIVRPLRLLNIEALRSRSIYEDIYAAGSVFDSSYIRRLEKAMFLKRLSKQITAPVMFEDKAADYLITQAIADYLGSRRKTPIDGIVYRSGQSRAEGLNIALFHKSSRVEVLDVPEGTTAELGRWSEDVWEPDYSVWEGVPCKSTEKGDGEDLHPSLLDWDFSDIQTDMRGPTLKVDATTLMVHHIKSISIETDPFPVFRDRNA